VNKRGALREIGCPVVLVADRGRMTSKPSVGKLGPVEGSISESPTTRPECAAREPLFYITTVTSKALTTLELRELHRPANLARLISPE